MENNTYWKTIRTQFSKNKLGVFALFIVGLFCVVGIYAPFLASSKPLWVDYDRQWWFPSFRYLFFIGFYTKGLDLFFNLLMFTTPLLLVSFFCLRRFPGWRKGIITAILVIQFALFGYFFYARPKDPASDPILNKERHLSLLNDQKEGRNAEWSDELRYMTPYAKLNALLRYRQLRAQNERIIKYQEKAPTLWQIDESNLTQKREHYEAVFNKETPTSAAYLRAKAQLEYLQDRKIWFQTESSKLQDVVMPLIRDFHWEDDAGGDQSLNQKLPWWELTRINRKDLVAALIFGVRISIVVGILAVGLALLISIPIGAYAGYYGGTFDILVSRLIEIWDSMPVFFMLLMIIAVTQNKSIFLVIAMIGFFGWTGFSRYIRGEFFKQRNLPYVEACHAAGFRDSHIMFSHILPNAIPPVLTLIPFAVMGAITTEAALSFLGLGEEGSTSWGTLMDEGRSAFPAESYLLWPPAILLTVLLVAIAVAGDALRDALDPKMHR